jgi:radical SAM protein with 4Fe4S-binding SPASM domain
VYIGNEHFSEITNADEAARLFKKSVALVAFSISSFCNRRCTYCPNSVVDRKSKQNFMSDELFFNILRQLAQIDYRGQINITRYNEPFSDKEYAMSRITEIRKFLPHAPIVVYTNGDYLDRQYLDDLAKCGVHTIVATVHSGPGGKTDIASLKVELRRRLAEMELTFVVNHDEEKALAVTAKHPDGLILSYLAHDFYRGSETGNAWAYDRGGSLPIPKTYVRKLPCLVQFTELNIEWDGSILPCCQIQNDMFANNDYVVGKLDGKSDIFLAWTAMSLVQWRRKMLSFETKTKPCASCSYGEPVGNLASLKATADQVQRALARMPA